MRTRLASLAVLAVSLIGLAAADVAIAQGTSQLPAPQGRVTDLANVLDDRAEADLVQRLQAVEDQTTAEIAVATVPSLQGMPVEEYAERLFRTWGIGQAGVDNGVLVLVAPTERAMRIEVGYGLEGVLPDGLAGDIIRTAFIPRFREDDYQGGILAGVARVAEIVQKNHVLTPEERQAFAQSGDVRPPRWLMVPFFGLFIGIGGFMAGLGIGARAGFPLLFGALFGGIPFVMSLIPFFNAPIVMLGPWGLLLAGAGFVRGRRKGFMRDVQTPGQAQPGRRSGRGRAATGTSAAGTGFSSDSSSSSSWGSSGSGSSSSFGGGSSGGGGASGRW